MISKPARRLAALGNGPRRSTPGTNRFLRSAHEQNHGGAPPIESRIFRQRLLLSAGIAAALSAATLQAADTVAYANNPSSNQFGTVDLNGVFTPITKGSTTGGFGVSGGALYGINAGYVFQANISTGAFTYAANYSLSNNLQGFGSINAGLFLVDGYGDLISVNPSTTTPTLIGSTGVTSGLGSGVLSTSADSSALYWVNNGASGNDLYRLNTPTGVATLVGATGNGAGSGAVEAMLFEGGTLWASLGYNTGPAIGTLNTPTATETIVTNLSVGSINALAPDPLSAPPSISTVSRLRRAVVAKLRSAIEDPDGLIDSRTRPRASRPAGDFSD